MTRPPPAPAVGRRGFLRGAGVAIALPVMESLAPPAAAAGRGRATKRMVVLSNNYGAYHKAFFPTGAGSDFDLPPTLAALGRHRGDFSVFSNLDHGLSGGHACVPTLLNGIMPYMASSFPEGNISLDQKAAESVGAATRYPSMALQVNDANLISFTRTGVQVPALDLRATYRALFLEEGAAEKAGSRERLQRHGSILDVVLDQARAVDRGLGARDREKFAEYLDSVRSLEKKIVQREPWLDRPKPETGLPEPSPGQGTEKDLKAMVELVALAIETDSTRCITLTSGFRSGDFGLGGGYHGFSHHGEREMETAALTKIEGYQIAMMAHLIDLLKAKPDPLNGGSLFDHTMVLYGCGMATGTHSTKNLPLLLAGGGFKLGDHKVYPAEAARRLPAANLLLSMAQNFGLEIDRFGPSTGTLRDLEWS